MTTVSVELVSSYQALAPLEKNIVRLLSLNIAPMRQDELTTCLDYLANRKLIQGQTNRTEFVAALRHLEKSDLTCKRKGLASYQPLIRNHVLLDVLDHDLFTSFNASLNALHRIGTTPRLHFFQTLDEGLRLLQGLLFTKSSREELNTVFEAIHRQFDHLMDSSPLESLFGPTIPLPILRHCTHRQGIGLHLLEIALDTMRPVPDIVALLVEDLRTAPQLFSPLSLVLYLLFTGDTDLAMEVIKTPEEDRHPLGRKCAQAALHFFQGRYEAANLLFAEFLLEYKKNMGKRKTAIVGLPGIFHLCSLLAPGKTQALEEGKSLLEISRKQDLHPAGFLQNLGTVYAQQQGLPSGQVHWDQQSCNGIPVHRFFYLLSLWWADRERALQVVPEECRLLYAQALKNDFPWIAAECAELLAAMGQDGEQNKKVAGELHERCRSVTCVALVQPKDKNMLRLHSLLALIGKDRQPQGAEVAPSHQRLIWLFSHQQSNSSCSLTPILQKMSKNGKWSKGRSVALKSLYEQYEKMEGLSDQDRQICRTLVHSRGYYYYNQDAYQFDMKKAIVAAIEHPALFLADNPGVQVELGRGEMELRISKEADSLTLSLWPQPPEAASTSFLQRESPTSFKVFQLSPAQENLLTLLRENLVLPANAIEQVRELASSLSAMVTVHSDVGGGQELEEVAADPLPCSLFRMACGPSSWSDRSVPAAPGISRARAAASSLAKRKASGCRPGGI